MITRVRIKNFMCLRDVDLALKPLTVLIGENDTGKSSVLEALKLIVKLAPVPAGKTAGKPEPDTTKSVPPGLGEPRVRSVVPMFWT